MNVNRARVAITPKTGVYVSTMNCLCGIEIKVEYARVAIITKSGDRDHDTHHNYNKK